MSLRVLNNEPNYSLEQKVGGLSNESKMPGSSWGISAFKCNVGSKLRKVEGSTCSECYALKNRYIMPSVQNALDRRYEAWHSNPELWELNFIKLLNSKAEDKLKRLKSKARKRKRKFIPEPDYFRWFPSGDLQNLDMLLAINRIAWATPNTAHWLPSREYSILRQFATLMKRGEVKLAPNLTIRVSAVKVGEAVRNKHKLPFPTSRVGNPVNKTGNCPAYKQDGKCGSCRACWDRSIPVITYPLH